MSVELTCLLRYKLYHSQIITYTIIIDEIILSYILFKWFDEFPPTGWKLNFSASDHGTNEKHETCQYRDSKDSGRNQRIGEIIFN